jgi:hypothetical protein
MSYTLNKTNSETLLTLLDGTTSDAGGLTFIGKNYVSYGEIQNENFVKLLENFANNVSPTDPLKGELWYDTSTSPGVLKVYDGVRYKPVSAQTTANTAPTTGLSTGDGWWDTTNDQYKVYSGTEWVVVGPAYSKLDGKSGAIVEVVYDTSATKHVVTSIYSNNNRTAIVSHDATFMPNVAITGFATISPGVNLSTAVSNNLLHGTSRNAQQLGNVVAANYARKDQTETFAVDTNVLGNVNVGTNLNAQISVVANVLSISNTLDDIVLQTMPGGSTVNSLTIDGITGNVSVRGVPTTPLGVATKSYVDLSKSEVIADLTANVVLINSNIDSNVGIINTDIDALTTRMDTAEQDITDLYILDSVKAPVDSPVLTGTPQTTTASLGNDSTQIASTAYVMNQDAEREYQTNLTIQANVDAINTDMTNRLELKANLASPALTGIPTAPHPVFEANTAQIATTQYVQIATKYWDGSAKFISTDYPDPDAGEIGDFWFRIES